MMNKNDLVELEITDIGSEGEGIGKVSGFTLFVKDTMPGDTVEARVMKLKKSYGYARLERVVKPSPFRINPVCPYARKCGGCQLQEMEYDRQLSFKENKVRNNLIRIGGVEPDVLTDIMEPIVGADRQLQYRNKAQFPFGTDKEGHVICGFYAGRTHSIISNTDCALGIPENKEILEIILEYMNRFNVEAYDETKGTGLVRHVLIRKGFDSGEIMVCFVLNCAEGMTLKGQEYLTDRLSKISGMASISLNYNNKNTNVIMGEKVKCIWGRSVIRDTMHVTLPDGEKCDGITYEISPLSFYQVNPMQVEKLYGIAVDYAGLTGNEEVWDLCCGIGTITLSMASNARKVHGIEIVPPAIEDAKANAKRNHIENAEFICAAAEEYLPLHMSSINADVIVMDPPRKGMDEKALEVVANTQPERIVYVSCDSATLARDVKYLAEHGYELKKVRAVDMFPQTVHVETVCLLSKLREAKHHVSVKLDMDEMDLTSAESKATYEEIKKYVAEHNDGMKVSSLNIAQVKRKCGIELGENYNLPKSEDARQPQCPKEKEEAIVEALKTFKMV